MAVSRAVGGRGEVGIMLEEEGEEEKGEERVEEEREGVDEAMARAGGVEEESGKEEEEREEEEEEEEEREPLRGEEGEEERGEAGQRAAPPAPVGLKAEEIAIAIAIVALLLRRGRWRSLRPMERASPPLASR